MLNKTLSLTIVIPAYNEEDYLPACLDSIASQTVMPDEVILVDNNSTDRTVEIARRYPFVRILKEARQHQAFAQHTGFEAAKGRLIGRIDADSVLPSHWVAAVKAAFESDPSLAAAKGSGCPYDVYGKKVARAVFLSYNRLASAIAGHNMLWGANCVIRRSVWNKVEDRVLLRDDIWEDYDLAFCAAPYGNVAFLDNIEIGTSFRAVHKSFMTQFDYQFRAIRTFYLRAGVLKAAILTVLWPTMTVFYPFVLIDHFVFKPLSRRLQKKTFTSAEALDGLLQ